MVKYNWIESTLVKLGVKRPKRFKNDARKQIEDSTLQYLQKYGRHKWISTEEIFRNMIEPTDLFNSKEGNFWFASDGIKSKVNSSTLSLRRKGHPIISGKGHKGYHYADENCDDFIYLWNEKFDAWEKRKTKIIKEKKVDIDLIREIIKSLLEKKRVEEAKELEKVLVKYKEKQKEEEE